MTKSFFVQFLNLPKYFILKGFKNWQKKTNSQAQDIFVI